MLDQNTDRMWFVIGAVIVGAAIIFIANGTLPTLFASVSDNFEDSSKKGLEVIEQISPVKNENLLEIPRFSRGKFDRLVMNHGFSNIQDDGSHWYGEIDSNVWATRFEKHIDIGEEDLGIYTYTVRAKINTDIENIHWMRHHGEVDVVRGEPYEGTMFEGNIMGLDNPVEKQKIHKGEWATYSTTVDVKEPGVIRIRGYMPLMPVGDNVTIEWEKLERGHVSTPL